MTLARVRQDLHNDELSVPVGKRQDDMEFYDNYDSWTDGNTWKPCKYDKTDILLVKIGDKFVPVMSIDWEFK